MRVKEKVDPQQDVEKSKGQHDVENFKSQSSEKNDASIYNDNRFMPNPKTNVDKLESFDTAKNSSKDSDSDADKAIRSTRLETEESVTARSDMVVSLFSVARPRTLPPLSLHMAQKPQKQPGAKKKKKNKTPKQDFPTNETLTCDGNNIGDISKVSSCYDYSISGVKPGHGNNKKHYESNNDDWTSYYRSKTFSYQ